MVAAAGDRRERESSSEWVVERQKCYENTEGLNGEDGLGGGAEIEEENGEEEDVGYVDLRKGENR